MKNLRSHAEEQQVMYLNFISNKQLNIDVKHQDLKTLILYI